MKDSSFTAEAIEAASNRTWGHRWTPGGVVEVPFTPIFPYGFGGAGAINSTVDDLSRWVRLHLAGGTFEGKRLVSAENLTATKTPKIAMSDKLAYAMGWVIQETPNGRIVWHNGGTLSYGSYIGTVPEKDIGVIVLTNEQNVGFPDAIGEWVLDRLMGNPVVDHVAARLAAAKAGFAAGEAAFAAPAARRPPPDAASLTGSFDSPSFGPVEVSQADGGLVAVLKATGARLALDPRDGDVFTVKLVPEGRFAAVAADLGPGPVGFVQFLIGKDGKVGRFVLLSGDNGQAYDFVRQ
jgi:hypothetical protein